MILSKFSEDKKKKHQQIVKKNLASMVRANLVCLLAKKKKKSVWNGQWLLQLIYLSVHKHVCTSVNFTDIELKCNVVVVDSQSQQFF